MASIPASIERRGSTFHVVQRRKSRLRVVVLSDLHVPHHDPAALELAITIARDFAPHILILNGDIVDFAAVSRFPQPPERRLLIVEELQKVRQVLAMLRARFPDAVMIYLAGNHEERLRSYLWRKAQELAGLPELSLPALLHLHELNIHYAETQVEPRSYSDYVAAQVVLAGRLYITHGHSIRTSGNVVNIARTIYLRTHVPMLVGHWHRTQHYEETRYDGTTSGSWVVGCLCYPRPHYDAGRIWGQGIALLTVHENDYFRPELVSFFRRDGRLHAIARGQHYSVKEQ